LIFSWGLLKFVRFPVLNSLNIPSFNANDLKLNHKLKAKELQRSIFIIQYQQSVNKPLKQVNQREIIDFGQ